MVEDAVEDGGGDYAVAEEIPPAPEALVGGHSVEYGPGAIAEHLTWEVWSRTRYGVEIERFQYRSVRRPDRFHIIYKIRGPRS